MLKLQKQILMSLNKAAMKKKQRVLKRWRTIVSKLLIHNKTKRDVECVSKLKSKVLQTNNFTEEVKPPLPSPPVPKVDYTPEVKIITDCIMRNINNNNLLKRHSVLNRFKARMLAVIKARKDRKWYHKVRKAILLLQGEFRRIISKRISEGI